MNVSDGLQMSFGQVFVTGNLVLGRDTEKDITTARSLTIVPACVATHLSEPITDFTSAIVPTTTGILPSHDANLSRTEPSHDSKVAYQPAPAGNRSRLTDGILDGCVSGTVEAVIGWILGHLPFAAASAFFMLAWCWIPVTVPLPILVVPSLLAIPAAYVLTKRATNAIKRKLKQPTSV